MNNFDSALQLHRRAFKTILFNDATIERDSTSDHACQKAFQTGGDVRFHSTLTHMVEPIKERIDAG
jgi:hypothetical protein